MEMTTPERSLPAYTIRKQPDQNAYDTASNTNIRVKERLNNSDLI
jgi:hypothetical protein